MPIIRIPGSEPGGGAPRQLTDIGAASAPGMGLAGVGRAIAGVGSDLAGIKRDREKKAKEAELEQQRAKDRAYTEERRQKVRENEEEAARRRREADKKEQERAADVAEKPLLDFRVSGFQEELGEELDELFEAGVSREELDQHFLDRVAEMAAALRDDFSGGAATSFIDFFEAEAFRQGGLGDQWHDKKTLGKQVGRMNSAINEASSAVSGGPREGLAAIVEVADEVEFLAGFYPEPTQEQQAVIDRGRSKHAELTRDWVVSNTDTPEKAQFWDTVLKNELDDGVYGFGTQVFDLSALDPSVLANWKSGIEGRVAARERESLERRSRGLSPVSLDQSSVELDGFGRWVLEPEWAERNRAVVEQGTPSQQANARDYTRDAEELAARLNALTSNLFSPRPADSQPKPAPEGVYSSYDSAFAAKIIAEQQILPFLQGDNPIEQKEVLIFNIFNAPAGEAGDVLRQALDRVKNQTQQVIANRSVEPPKELVAFAKAYNRVLGEGGAGMASSSSRSGGGTATASGGRILFEADIEQERAAATRDAAAEQRKQLEGYVERSYEFALGQVASSWSGIPAVYAEAESTDAKLGAIGWALSQMLSKELAADGGGEPKVEVSNFHVADLLRQVVEENADILTKEDAGERLTGGMLRLLRATPRMEIGNKVVFGQGVAKLYEYVRNIAPEAPDAAMTLLSRAIDADLRGGAPPEMADRERAEAANELSRLFRRGELSGYRFESMMDENGKISVRVSVESSPSVDGGEFPFTLVYNKAAISPSISDAVGAAQSSSVMDQPLSVQQSGQAASKISRAVQAGEFERIVETLVGVVGADNIPPYELGQPSMVGQALAYEYIAQSEGVLSKLSRGYNVAGYGFRSIGHSLTSFVFGPAAAGEFERKTAAVEDQNYMWAVVLDAMGLSSLTEEALPFDDRRSLWGGRQNRLVGMFPEGHIISPGVIEGESWTVEPLSGRGIVGAAVSTPGALATNFGAGELESGFKISYGREEWVARFPILLSNADNKALYDEHARAIGHDAALGKVVERFSGELRNATTLRDLLKVANKHLRNADYSSERDDIVSPLLRRAGE